MYYIIKCQDPQFFTLYSVETSLILKDLLFECPYILTGFDYMYAKKQVDWKSNWSLCRINI